MSGFAIIVTRADGRLQPVRSEHVTLDKISEQAFRFARNAAIHGCPLGDALPPRWVDIVATDGELILRIVVDDSLKPTGGIAI